MRIGDNWDGYAIGMCRRCAHVKFTYKKDRNVKSRWVSSRRRLVDMRSVHAKTSAGAPHVRFGRGVVAVPSP
jgi:hypothetical protein